MQHRTPIHVMQLAIRAKVCTTCYQRPLGSESLAPTVPRTCEGGCTIFINLPKLKQIADAADNIPGAYEHAMRQLICSKCAAVPTAGDYCADSLARTCPLSRYAGQVIQLLEKIPAA